MARRENRLNDLDGSQWLYWTDTLYITNFPPDATHPLRQRHGAMKPPELMAEIIRFFTKKGELVLDPFAGVGGTLIGADLTEREALGFELNRCWVQIFEEIKSKYVIVNNKIVPRENAMTEEVRLLRSRMEEGDCLELIKGIGDETVDAVITDPPYGCQHYLSGFKKETNFNMFNPAQEKDFGNAASFEMYFCLMADLGREVWRVLKPGKYFILLIGDRYRNGEYIPLGFRVAETMREVGFRLKGVKIWCNQATRRPLRPYAVYQCFVPNISHQNILILRKE
ncbi:DNA methyltransferase [Calderihabitans maritimus]|uniref:DNA methyltransferase n=1 Tax=Calderihabitans maritimus TaxID=1246530 RepID=UPI0018641E94|nr:DNA methyltransferase [Calderihabitans maritimus]